MTWLYLYALIGFAFGAWCFVDCWKDGVSDDEMRLIVSTVKTPRHQKWLSRFAGTVAGMTIIHALFWPIVIYVLLTPGRPR